MLIVKSHILRVMLLPEGSMVVQWLALPALHIQGWVFDFYLSVCGVRLFSLYHTEFIQYSRDMQ